MCLGDMVHDPEIIGTHKDTKVLLEKGQINTISNTTKLTSLQLALRQPT